MKAPYSWILCYALVACSCSNLNQSDRDQTSFADDMILVEPANGTSFRMDATPVTVAAFQRFVDATSYITQAEQFGNSGVFDVESQTWILAEQATFLSPFGKTGPPSPLDAPATQVSYYDAKAFCSHYGKRLPSVMEWEAAAKSGQPHPGAAYPWGDEIKDKTGAYRANVWQGIFPVDQRIEDGYAAASPVKAFPPTASGFYDLAGNVWEWTTDTLAGAALPGEEVHRITKGGSFLCEPSWCHGYLITGQSNTSPETGLYHTGFRCVCDPD